MASNIVSFLRGFLHITLLLVVIRQTQAVPQGRIIDGYLASENQFPWHVLLNYSRTDNSIKFCGGSLIAPNFVLTAASCIENAITIKVHAGIISFHSPTESQNSSLYRIHPYYNFTGGLYDIAIIKLDKNFTYPDNVGSILLPGNSQVNTLAQSYVKGNSKNPGFAAQKREAHKKTLYRELEANFHFVPVCVETLGTWGEEGKKLIPRIGELLQNITGEKRSTSFLIQRISVAVQKGNAASILGTVPADTNLDEIYYL